MKTKARLEPGKMFLVDFDEGAIISDNIIKEQVTTGASTEATVSVGGITGRGLGEHQSPRGAR